MTAKADRSDAATGKPGPGAEPFPRPLLPVMAAVDGRNAQLLYAGLAPGFVGLLQVNLIVPAATAPGARLVELTIGGETGRQAELLHVAP